MITTVILWLAASAAPSPHLRHIAVLDVEAHAGVAPELARSVTSVVVLEVRRQARGASVLGADDVRAMVGLEQERQKLACSGPSCLAEIGGALGAERLVLGSLSRFGDAYLFDVRLVDSRNGSVLAEGSARFKGESTLPEAVARSVEGLFSPAAPGTATSVDLTSPAVAPAPRSHALAWTLLAGGSVAAVFAIVGLGEVLDFQSANSTFQATPTLANYASATAAAGRANLWGPVAIACAAGAAVLGGGVALAW